MSRTCEVCNKVFPNGKSWGGHIRACYKKEKEKYYWSSSESESEFQGRRHGDGDGAGAESSTKVVSAQPINLMEHLPRGWSKNTKRRRDFTEQSSTDDDILKMATIKLLSLPSVLGSKQKVVGEELAKYQNKFAQHLSVNKKPMKVNAYAKEKRPADFVEGHKRTYVCRICGLVFDNFQGLGGHLAAHNRKRLMEKVGESDVMEKGENVITGSATAPARKEYKCNLCGKSFPSGQALGGHKSYHSSAAYTAGYNLSTKALVEHKSHHNTAHNTELKHSGQALGGHKSNYSTAHSTADMGYSHDETSCGVVSHSNPPSSAEVSNPDPPLGHLLDLNMAPDEGLWGF